MAKRADVARAAGVAESTVSYALTGARPIAEETKARIFKAMADLDYRPNAMAQALRSGNSKMIAMLFGDQERGISDGDIEYVMAAANEARAFGYHLILWPVRRRAIEDVVAQADSGLLAGAILMEVALDDDRVKLLKEHGIPFSLIGRTRDETDTVFADRDFEAATKLAVKHLVDLGHKELLFLSTSTANAEENIGATVRSEKASQAAAKELGAKIAILHSDTTIQAGLDASKEFLRKYSGKTAVVSVNAEGLIGFARGLQRAGVRIAEDVSLVCISTTNAGALAFDPPLTTVTPPAIEIGAAAARELIHELEGQSDDEPQKLFVGDLEMRDSTAPVRDHKLKPTNR